MQQDFFKKNYFELLELPETFDVDQSLLKNNYRTLQRVVHPDRFANKSDQEKRIAMQMAAQVNTAFNTLKEPVSRASYLLSLRGLRLDFEKNTLMDSDFLMQQFEWRERVAAGDESVADDILIEKEKLITALSDFFKTKQDNLEAAAEKVYQLQFYEKLLID